MNHTVLIIGYCIYRIDDTYEQQRNFSLKILCYYCQKRKKSRFGLDGLVTSKNTKMTRPPLSSLTLAVNLADEKPKHLLTCPSLRPYLQSETKMTAKISDIILFLYA